MDPGAPARRGRGRGRRRRPQPSRTLRGGGPRGRAGPRRGGRLPRLRPRHARSKAVRGAAGSPGAVVSVGPTLAGEKVDVPDGVVGAPPGAQGDVYRAVRQGARLIGIIDGYFEDVPSVWHKEILWAMDQGVHVFGGAS